MLLNIEFSELPCAAVGECANFAFLGLFRQIFLRNAQLLGRFFQIQILLNHSSLRVSLRPTPSRGIDTPELGKSDAVELPVTQLIHFNPSKPFFNNELGKGRRRNGTPYIPHERQKSLTACHHRQSNEVTVPVPLSIHDRRNLSDTSESNKPVSECSNRRGNDDRSGTL
jgi:hypothetical protein